MSRTVLVADDNLTIQRMASEMLTLEGMEVVTVANGMAAIKKLFDAMPLVVLADVDMPGKDGYEVCDFVKSNPELHYVRVLLTVSDADPYDPERGTQAHADGIVKKPFEREQLVSMVTECVNQAEAARPAPAKPTPPPARAPEPSISPSNPEQQKAGPAEPSVEARDTLSDPETDRAAEPAPDKAYPLAPESAGEMISKPPLNPVPLVADPEAEACGESSQFSTNTISWAPAGEAPAEEAMLATEHSWNSSQFSTAIGFSELEHADTKESSSAQAFEPLTPFGTPPENPASGLAWTPSLSDTAVPDAHEPERQTELPASPLEEQAPAHLNSENVNASHASAIQAEEPASTPRSESRYEEMVEFLLVDEPQSTASVPPLEIQNQNHGPVDPSAEVAFEPPGSPPEAIEWDEFEQDAKSTLPLDPGTVAEIVQKVVAKMAPPALSAEALQELKARITADLLSDLNLT